MNNLSKLLMSSALCTVCTMVSAQQVNVSGVIKDATGRADASKCVRLQKF